MYPDVKKGNWYYKAGTGTVTGSCYVHFLALGKLNSAL